MIHRLLNPIKSNSFFLFGARGTGKSTFLRQWLPSEKTLWIDLLSEEWEWRLSKNPDELYQIVTTLPKQISWIVIDEVQKIPKLLDIVHRLIESTDKKFALTGSSARKLKRGGANLLAGRAYLNHMFPLTAKELGTQFDLFNCLAWGSLPKLFHINTDEEKRAYLRSYAHSYLKEEVWAEQYVQDLEPFRRFLEVAAQSSGDVVNYAHVARDVGSDSKTVQKYFQILEDTLIGFHLHPYHKSVRKQHLQNPKFYFFDIGVKRALDGSLVQTVVAGTSGFGRLFEHAVILECLRLNDYLQRDYRFYYLRTYQGLEVDLVVERPGQPLLFVEIKSAEVVQESDVKTLHLFLQDHQNSEAICLSREHIARTIGNVTVYPWQQGLAKILSTDSPTMQNHP